jgi:outer membrane protein OmpA-like peptidoglycan-associated protein
MATLKTSPHISILLASVLSPISSATAQNLGPTIAPPVQALTEGSLFYTGDSAQASIGLTQDGQLHSEISGVLHESATHAWLGEAWNSGDEGGLKLSHHQLNTPDSVRKLFVAIDRNTFRDRKVTLGYGKETAHWFGQVSLSKGLTGQRLVGQQESTTETQNKGQVGEQHYLDFVSDTLQTRWFQKAYDYGIGLRIGRHIEVHNIRLSAGLDHEWGQANARQNTASLMAEKVFPGSPHSIAVQLSHAHQAGLDEPTRNDTRGMLIYRYSLGKNNSQAERRFQLQPKIHPAPVQPPLPPAPPARPTTRIEKQWVKTKVIMNADAFFDFDSATLTTQAQAELQRIVQLLQTQGREGPMHITGHTCDIGSDRVNDRLSLARAQAVKNHLLTLGAIGADDTIVQGQGKRSHKYPATAATRAQNRRVELEFFSFTPVEKEIEITIPAPQEPATQPLPPAAPIVTYERIPLEQAPAWIQRALRTPIQHNRTVSTYRIKEETHTQNTLRQWINQAPQAQNDQYTLEAGTSIALNVLDNDRDPDTGDAISILSVTPPANGNVRIVGRQIIYTSQATQIGLESFNYTIQDSQGLHATAQVSIQLTAPQAPEPVPEPPAPKDNRAPQANADRFGVSGRVPSNLPVLDNDTDPDGDILTITDIQQPIANSGRVEIGKNSILFTPNYPFMIDWFTYSISDGKGGTSSATVQLVDP